MITPVPPVVIPPYPTSTVQPFTYKDGLSYLDRLEMLQKYINRIIIPFVNDSYNELSVEVQEQVNTVIAAFNEAVDAIVNGSITVQDPIVAALINNATSQTRIALNTLLDGKVDKTVYDAAILGLNNDIDALELSVAGINTNITNLKNTYVVYRLWTGTAYPARIAGALNLFFGPTDPGLAMVAGTDFWANPNVTTLTAVIAAAADSSNALYKSIQATAFNAPVVVRVGPQTSQALDTVLVGSSPARLPGIKMPKAFTPVIYGTAFCPPGWNTARVAILYTHDVVSGNGNIRFSTDLAAGVPGTALVGANVASTDAVPAQGLVKKLNVALNVNMTAGGIVTISVGRLSTSGSDTFTGDIVIVGVWLEKVS